MVKERFFLPQPARYDSSEGVWLTVDAVLARDFPVIQAIILLLSFVYVMINMVIDIAYSFFDPRIRY